MIVRINQIDIATAEAGGGWPAGPYVGGLRGAWAADVRAFELLILSQDERKQPLPDGFRQQQLRQMIPQAAIALAAAGDVGVLRLDGPVAERELLPAWRHLADPDGRGRFAFAATAKTDDAAGEAAGSVRVAGPWRRLAGACADPDLGLERSVRARLLFVPEPSVPAVLEAAAADDPRWDQLLPECRLVVAPTAGLRSLHLFAPHADVAQVKAKVMARLMAVARGEPAVPG